MSGRVKSGSAKKNTSTSTRRTRSASKDSDPEPTASCTLNGNKPSNQTAMMARKVQKGVIKEENQVESWLKWLKLEN